MAEIHYPYVDLTVLPEISPHVLAPHAAVVFSTDLSRIFWANGEGAKLIGTPTIGLAVEGSAAPNKSTMRQIEMAAEKLEGADQASAVMRVRLGFQTKLLAFNVKNITLPGGEQATLLVTDALHGRRHKLEDMAQAAVDCLDGSSHASAVFDRQGRTIGTSSSFEALGISQQELKKLADELSDEDDRLVKRMMETAVGSMAFGAARIGEASTHHLIILMDTESTVEATSEILVAEDVPSKSSESAAPKEEPAQPAVGAFSSKRIKPGQAGPGRWYFKQPAPDDDEPEAELIQAEEPVEKTLPLRSGATDASEKTEDSETGIESEEDTIAAGGLIKTMDHTPLDKSSEETPAAIANPTPELKDMPVTASEDGFRDTKDAQPVRFVWEMDANTMFSHVSDELQQAVGEKGASITGLSWQEVSWFYGLNEEKEISALLEKGETWSGKTVLWPIDGTDLRVPIDLSARPTFDRNRDFTGFSGFGIIRLSDAVIDSEVAGIGFEGKEPPPDTLKPGKIKGRKVVRKPEITKPSQEETGNAVEEKTAGAKQQPETGKALSSDERSAFDEIGEKLTDAAPTKPKFIAPAPKTEEETEQKKTTAKVEVAKEPKPPVKRSNRKINAPDHDVDTSILARLPIPVLVYRDQDLLFANTQFFELTGFNTLEELAEAGGVEALFGSHISTAINEYAKIYHRDGSSLNVFPNLQRVPWDAERAMLLTLRRQGPDDGDDEGSSPPSDNEGKADKDTSEKKIIRPARNISVVVPSGVSVTKPLKAPPIEPDKPVSSAKPSKSASPAKKPAKPVSVETFAELNQSDLRGILDTATDGVVILTEDGNVESLNRSAEALFDCDTGQAQGKSFTEFLAPESRLVAADYLAEFGKPGVAGLLNDGREVIGQTARGGLIPLFMTTGRMESKESKCVILKDITQWKKAEEELLNAKQSAEAASSQKSDFLAKISHEVRTPLNAIIGFSDIMIEERFGKIENERYKDYLRDIHRSGTHVLELINDLLDISKIEAGQMELNFDACDLNALVSETVALSQPQANKERVIIRTSLSTSVPQVVADHRSLRQIILNLVTNGIKFSRSGGQVIVSTAYADNGEVALRVRDTGVGMSQGELQRAMKPFAQVEAAAELRQEGTGLGLPLTKAMVEANRAKFHIESESGKGTLVEITIPTQRVLAER